MDIITVTDQTQYRQLCKEVVQTLPGVSLFGRDVYLKLNIEGQDDRSAELGIDLDSSTRRLKIKDIKGPIETNLKLTELVLKCSTSNLEMLKQKTDLSSLFEQGYSVSEGEIVLSAYPRPSSEKAGYDWSPDEDDHDQTLLRFKKPSLELRVSWQMPDEPKIKVLNWFSGLKKKYGG